jgi:acyl-CoA thioesterase-1
MCKAIVIIGSFFMMWLSGQSQIKKQQAPGTYKVRENIVFFGNSLTAGYGVDPSEAFPSLIQAKINSLKLPYQVINAGLSGETSAGGNSRIDWVLRQPVYIFVLELGGNDGLRGIPRSETTKNLQVIIDKVRRKYPSAKIILAGMQIPPSMGEKYTSEFRAVFQQLAVRNKIYLIPFLLEGVGGVPGLNQQDGIHPNEEGHKIVAENIWKVLKPML